MEKNKVHVQQLEGDVIRCRDQVSRSEGECRAAQRELKRLQMDADDQRDALANEVRCTKNNNNNVNSFSLKFIFTIACEAFPLELLREKLEREQNVEIGGGGGQKKEIFFIVPLPFFSFCFFFLLSF